MKRYRFRLATLLKLREADRDERRAQLAEAYRADQILQDRLDQCAQELSELRGRYASAARPGVISIDQLVDSQRYEGVIRGDQAVASSQRARLAPEIEKRRQALIAADREVRVLEKLRETQLERHQADALHAETKVLDEVASRIVREDDD